MLEEAKKILRTADHMIYVTFPLVKEKKLLLRIFEQLYTVMASIVNAVLQHEYAYKRIRLYSDQKINLETFARRAAYYGFNETQIENIKEIFGLMQQHKQSPIEFARHDKIIIMSDSLKTSSITLEQLKQWLATAKQILGIVEIRLAADRV